MKFLYDPKSGRIVRRYWKEDEPEWWSNPESNLEKGEEPISQQSRNEILENARNGVDYDPQTEIVVAYLTYNANSGMVEGDYEIKPLQS
jgi:hypothetical protein